MVYGYGRVSTKNQSRDGYSLHVQAQEILSKYPDAIIIQEAYTGATTNRPLLNSLINQIQTGDILCVTKLDRLARNTQEGITIIEGFFNRGVSVHVLNIGLLEDTAMGRFFLTVLLAVAEMEKTTIIERTQAGKEIARTKAGYKEGRPQLYTREQLNHAMLLLENNSFAEVARMTKISESTLARERRRRRAQALLSVGQSEKVRS